MRNGWVSGCGAAGGTMLLLVAVAMIAQPNVRVLEEAFSGWLGRGEAEPTALADQLTVRPDRVSGRVANPSSTALARVDVTVRLFHATGEPREASATVFDLAPGAEAWFGIPLIGGPAVTRAELVDVRATAGMRGAGPTDAARPHRRGGAGGMRDVERMEREMKQMEEATRAATGG